MEINFLAVLAAAMTSLLVGFVWYHPKVFGTIWKHEAGMTQGNAQSGNTIMLFVLSFIFAVLLAFIMQPLTIHQFGAFGMIGGDLSLAKPSYTAFMNDYAEVFRTFKHGALHGFMSGMFIAVPILGTNCLMEKKSFKYAAISSGYWIVVMTIMGGIICGWK